MNDLLNVPSSVEQPNIIAKKPRMVRLSTTLAIAVIVGLIMTGVNFLAYSMILSSFTPGVTDPAILRGVDNAREKVETALKEGEAELLLEIDVEDEVCMGDPIAISWQGDERIEYVSLYLNDTNSIRPIGDYPLDFVDGERVGGNAGKYTWPAGERSDSGYVDEGYLYRIGITGRYTTADGTPTSVHKNTERFALLDCPIRSFEEGDGLNAPAAPLGY
ncbi:MAG: hypothetical protein WD200_02395 [Candidatus Andersenbacteria bacterium]